MIATWVVAVGWKTESRDGMHPSGIAIGQLSNVPWLLVYTSATRRAIQPPKDRSGNNLSPGLKCLRRPQRSHWCGSAGNKLVPVSHMRRF
ncbi:hypothetical protein M407DRAFT_108513 [Tulasnella calospora MUT 4182]|uniref:Uncharacterized protein n=1 Tax=Tulasnella calospora MUT 4182 TaxID=1051891 RepID=A0A0C3QTB1_9AGAM|nr:hypothetical protein M407DRAFT_108513 [Tulasnella calospora MUT 4182]